MLTIDGHCDPRFTGVREAFFRNFTERGDVGAAVCVYLDGARVVDCWGGHADAARTRAWTADTIVSVASTTKGMVALCAHMLAERGKLDLDAPVARYWPEFAAGGKDRVKVSHLMSHAAGLSGWKQPITTQDLYDWEKATALLAAQAPYWEPGTAPGYHALTQGYLVGEVVRRITGRSLGTEPASPGLTRIPSPRDSRKAAAGARRAPRHGHRDPWPPATPWPPAPRARNRWSAQIRNYRVQYRHDDVRTVRRRPRQPRRSFQTRRFLSWLC